MPKLLLGSVLGGLAMWIVGFIFWGTPLSRMALTSTDEPTSAALHGLLAQHLGPLGTGAYPVPWTGTPAGTQLYGQGPTGMIFFNSQGFALNDSGALIGGLILAIMCVAIAGFALRSVAGGLDFGAKLRLIMLVSVAVTAYSNIGQPVFNHMPWGYFIYLWISDFVSWIAAGAVLAWALPKPSVVQPERMPL